MTSTSSIVTNALEYYDNNNEKYKMLKDKSKYVKIQNKNNDIDHNIIFIYDENKNLIFKSRYELIGMLSNESKIWTWGWAVPYQKKKSINIVKDILLYGINLSPNEDNILKTELITSRFRVANDTQLDIHISLSSYLSKNPLIFEYSPNELNNSLNNYEYTESTNREGLITSFLFLLDYDNFTDDM